MYEKNIEAPVISNHLPADKIDNPLLLFLNNILQLMIHFSLE